jgi:two-component system cell cycle sensor histidine kinase/response regulator CckA
MASLRARLEEQFRQAQRLASVGRVTSEVAHDFNNLLMVILGCSESSLRGLPPDDPARPFLRDAVKAGHVAAGLMRQVLAVSRARPDAGAPGDLNAVVSDLEPILRRVAGRGVEVALELEGGLGKVKADRGGLEQVLLNLVANARDAMPQGGRLTLATRREGAGAVLAVTDTGVGMDAETRARVFEPFFTTKGDGTGLGLAIVLDTARRHGGRVELDSEPGRGTAVRVWLPLADG